MNDIVVYTAITKGYDQLKEPKMPAGIDFVCFTDDQLESDHWQLKAINLPQINDPTRKARYIKLHPHLFFPDHQWSIWVDGSLTINGNLKTLQEEVSGNSKIGVYEHAKRNCIYQAAANCIDKQKDSPAIINEQIKHYLSINYPANNGLVSSGVLVRSHHNHNIIKLMDSWWKEIKRFSRRDQLSFNYVCWLNHFNYYAIPERIGDGRFFLRGPHITDPQLC